jgi:hypothetical protein
MIGVPILRALSNSPREKREIVSIVDTYDDSSIFYNEKLEHGCEGQNIGTLQ